MKRLVWEVDPAPTGRYRSFEKRSWPRAFFKGTQYIACAINCEDEYIPRDVKTGNHKELVIRIAIHSKVGFTWGTLLKRAKTLKEAKALAEDFFERNTHLVPEANREKKA